MRENRLSGSEGGGIIYRFSLPLFWLDKWLSLDSGLEGMSVLARPEYGCASRQSRLR